MTTNGAPAQPAVLERVEAAAYTKLGLTKLAELTACGQIPSLTIGRRRLYRRAALDKWLEELEARQAA